MISCFISEDTYQNIRQSPWFTEDLIRDARNRRREVGKSKALADFRNYFLALLGPNTIQATAFAVVLMSYTDELEQ